MNSINKNIQIKILNYFKIYDFTRILHDFSLKISKSILQIQEKKITIYNTNRYAKFE